jgi:hypothetical protein
MRWARAGYETNSLFTKGFTEFATLFWPWLNPL